jgi:hypothetical protein
MDGLPLYKSTDGIVTHEKKIGKELAKNLLLNNSIKY